MKNSKSKNKQHLAFLVFGMIIGVFVILAAGAAAYQMSGRDLKSKVRYVINKAEQNIKSYSQKIISDIPRKVIDTNDEKVSVLHLDIDADNPVGTVNPMIYGSNLTAKTEFEMDIAKFGKDIGITNVRYPGGNSLGYRWKLATFDFEERYDHAPLSNMENVVKFCSIMGSQLVIQVNIESGTSEEAAQWVEYMNKGRGVRVDYWELGNEVFGDWDKAYMSGENYVKVVKEYASAMRRVDPTIKIGANWGGERYQAFDEAVIKGVADDIDFVSYHWYPNHINQYHRYKERNHPLAKEVMANAFAVEKMVNRFNQLVLKYAPHRAGKIEFTVMEWDGSWDAASSDLEFTYQGMVWSLANAIFHADALGQFALHGVTVANQYTLQEVMFGLIRGWDKEAGWGGSRWDGETVRPKALALQLFSRHFGEVLLENNLTGTPTYYKEADWRADSYTGDVPYVSSYVSKTSDDQSLIIVLTNKHAEKNFKVHISVNNRIVKNEGNVWILNGPKLEAQNDGAPGMVRIERYNLSNVQNKFSYDAPKHSVNLLKIPLQDFRE